jgi:hypothetical protein
MASQATAQFVCHENNLGTAVGTGDDSVLPAPIGFAFPFHGATYSNLFISTNGFVYLSNAASVSGGAMFTASAASLVASADPILAPYWTDLNVISGTGNVMVNSSASKCVVTWDHVVEYGDTEQFQVQMQLYATGDIVYSYSPNVLLRTGGDCVVGMSPGGNVAIPAASDWSTAPFVVPDTSFEIFNNTGLTFDVPNKSVLFTPSGATQYLVQLPNCATNTSYGNGCLRSVSSFYENFAPASAFDLGGSSMTLVNTGSGYFALAGMATYHAPSANAVALALGDDSSVAVQLSGPFSYPGGSTSSLVVCSNGFVSAATGNTITWLPDVATLLNSPQAAWFCWHDFNPTAAGSGAVKFEEIGTVACVTWDGVWDYGGTSAANASTFQLQFDEASGNVSWVWQSMSALGGSTGTAILVGYSPGGSSVDPGSNDLSAQLAGGMLLSAADVLPVALAAAPAPVLGSTVIYTTSNIPAATVLSALLMSFGQINPGIDLGAIGAPGCSQLINTSGSSSTALFGTPTVSQSLFIPAVPAFAGTQLYCQTATLTPGANSLGVLTSNGIKTFVQGF